MNGMIDDGLFGQTCGFQLGKPLRGLGVNPEHQLIFSELHHFYVVHVRIVVVEAIIITISKLLISSNNVSIAS